MLLLVRLRYVLMHFHIIYNVFWTNLLTQCPVQFLFVFVRASQKKVKNKSARQNPEKFLKNIQVGRLQKPKGFPRGPPPGQAPPWRGQGGGRAT